MAKEGRKKQAQSESVPDPADLLRRKAVEEYLRSEQEKNAQQRQVHAPVRSGVGRLMNPYHGVNVDLSVYERLQENPEIRLLTVDDLPAVGDLYKKLQISPDTFELLRLRDVDDFKEEIQKGCFIDRWEPLESEKRALLEMNPQYVCSRDEFQTFLDGTHPRAADFKAWGHFHPDSGELLSIASAFLPPQDAARRRMHGEQVREFFAHNDDEGKKFMLRENHDREWVNERSETTAEFYLVGSSVRGLAATDFEHMLQQPEVRERDISDWYLLRFGSFRMLKPVRDDRVTCDSQNYGSAALFGGKLGFGDYGSFIDHHQFAARETRAGQVVVVRPGWIVMHGENTHVRGASHTWSTYLRQQAEITREQQHSSAEDASPGEGEQRPQ